MKDTFVQLSQDNPALWSRVAFWGHCWRKSQGLAPALCPVCKVPVTGVPGLTRWLAHSKFVNMGIAAFIAVCQRCAEQVLTKGAAILPEGESIEPYVQAVPSALAEEYEAGVEVEPLHLGDGPVH